MKEKPEEDPGTLQPSAGRAPDKLPDMLNSHKGRWGQRGGEGGQSE